MHEKYFLFFHKVNKKEEILGLDSASGHVSEQIHSHAYKHITFTSIDGNVHIRNVDRGAERERDHNSHQEVSCDWDFPKDSVHQKS